MRRRSSNRPYKLIHRKGLRVQVEFDHIPGRCLTTDSFDDEGAILWAEAKLARDTGQVNPTVSQKTTLRDFAAGFFSKEDPKGFIKRQKARGYSFQEAEYERRQAYLDNYILPAHGSLLINSISDVLIEDLIIDLKSVRWDQDLSNDSKNKVLAAYKDVMKEAKRLGYIKDNPCDTVQRMAENGAGRTPFSEDELKALFPEDREKLLFVWRSLQWAVYFLVMKDTGWRPGEVAGLSKLNYYPELHGVFTTGSVGWDTHEYRESVKTSRKGLKFREGILTDRTAELLEELIRYRPYSNYLFLIDGRFPTNTTQNYHLRDAAARAHVELDGRTQYSFRHTFQTDTIGRIPEAARLLLMGHTKTRQEYSHLTPEQNLKRILEIEGVKDVVENR